MLQRRKQSQKDLAAEFLIEDSAERNGVPVNEIKGIADQETGFLGYKPTAKSPAGARGSLQVMPGTALRHVTKEEYGTAAGQIEAGVKEYKRVRDRYGANLAPRAYHGGDGAVNNPNSYDHYAKISTNDYQKSVLQNVERYNAQTPRKPDLVDEFLAEEDSQAPPPINQAESLVREMTKDGQSQVISPKSVPARGTSPAKQAAYGATTNPTLDLDLSEYIKAGKAPSHAELAKLVYGNEKLGFTDEEASAYAKALGKDTPTSFYEAADPTLAAASIFERAKQNDRGLASIAGLTPEALKDKQTWLQGFREQKRLEGYATLSPQEKYQTAIKIASERPLTDKERNVLGAGNDWASSDRLETDIVNPLQTMAGNVLQGAGVLESYMPGASAAMNALGLGEYSPSALAKEGGSAITDLARTDKNLRGGDEVADQLISGASGSVPYLLTGGAGRVAVGALGALSGAGSMYDEAKKAGASEDKANLAGVLGAPVGLTNIFGVGSSLGRGAITNVVKSILLEGGEEATQSTVEKVLQNLIAKGIYDPKRGFLQDVPKAALMSFVLGGAVGGTGRALSSKGSSVEVIGDEQAIKASDGSGVGQDAIIENNDRGNVIPQSIQRELQSGDNRNPQSAIASTEAPLLDPRPIETPPMVEEKGVVESDPLTPIVAKIDEIAPVAENQAVTESPETNTAEVSPSPVKAAMEEAKASGEPVNHHIELQNRNSDGTLAQGVKERGLSKTLESAGLEKGTNTTYTPTTLAEGVERAKTIVKEKGIDGAMEWAKNPDNDGIEWASVGYEAMGQSREMEAKLRATDPKAADEIAMRRMDFLDDFAAEATRKGQAIVGIKAIEEFAPDRAAFAAAKASRKNRGRGLSTEEEARITKQAEELQSANNLLKVQNKLLEDKLATTKQKIKPTVKKNFQTALEEQGMAAMKALKQKLGMPYVEEAPIQETAQVPSGANRGGQALTEFFKDMPQQKRQLKETDSLVTAIIKMGGIKLEGERGREIQSRLDRHGRPGVVTKKGRPIEDAIHDLEASGYPAFTKDRGAVGVEALNELSDRIEAELRGDKTHQIAHQEKLDADFLDEDFADWGTPALNLGVAVKAKERGAATVRRGTEAPLQGDAELLAQYAAGRLSKVDTLKDLKAELVKEFGEEISPHLSDIAKRAYSIRQEARLSEMAVGDSQSRRTILSDIQKEIAGSKRAEAETEKAFQLEQRELNKQIRQATTKEARGQAQEAKRAAKEERKQMAEDARARLVQARYESLQASEAERLAYRNSLKESRKAEKEATAWSAPIKNEAREARVRLANATDPASPETISDLAAVAAEKFLPKDGKGVARIGAVLPRNFYGELRSEFPSLFTKKNEGQIYKQAYERAKDMAEASREVARLKSAGKESRQLWDELGIDEEAQAIMIRRAEAMRQQQEARAAMIQEFNYVSRSRTKRVASELWNLPRALQSSVDAPLGRQGLFYLVTHPVQTMRYAVPGTLKGYTSLKRGTYENHVKNLQSHPDYELAKQSELSGSIFEGGSEEQFRSGWGDKIPHARLSEQAFNLGMDAQRLAVFSKYADIGRAEGYTFESHPEFFKQAAEFVNAATGRAKLPDVMKKASPLLNTIFYSPRLQVSRIKLMNNLLNPKNYIGAEFSREGIAKMIPKFKDGNYDPAMRKIAAQEVMRAVVGFGLIYGTFAALSKKDERVKMTADPSDSDFGKVVVGNTRYDLSGGEAGLIRFFYRLAQAVGKKATGERIEYGKDATDILLQWSRSKLAPVPGAVVNLLDKPAKGRKDKWLEGSDLIGKPANLKFDPKNKIKTMQENQILKLLLPMLTGDLTEAIIDDGWMGVVKTAPALGGIGANTYKKEKKGASGATRR